MSAKGLYVYEEEELVSFKLKEEKENNMKMFTRALFVSGFHLNAQLRGMLNLWLISLMEKSVNH